MDLSYNYKLVSWLRRGYRRKKVLRYLNKCEKPVTPTEISKSTKLALVKVSMTLGQLREKKFVKCLNPEAPYTRFYVITNKGKKFLELVTK